MKLNLVHNHLKGKVVLSTVSGVASTKPALIKYFDERIAAVNIITTKSYQVLPNPGNREPIICEMENGSFGNSVGLRNPGMVQGIEDIKSVLPLNNMLNVSLSASSVEDFITLIRAFSPWADCLELNFSCPHAAVGYGSSIGSSAKIAGEYVKKIREAVGVLDVPIYVKLTPNVDNLGQIAKAVISAGANGIVAINTVGPVVHIDATSKKPILNNNLGGKGGMSGKWVHQKAIESIKVIRKAIGDDIVIIGMGGADSGQSVADLIKAGADAVGIGSALAKVKQKDWSEYLDSVKVEAQNILHNTKIVGTASSVFMDNKIKTKYIAHKIISLYSHSEDIVVMTVSGEMNCKAGEYVFLWHPDFGEKPFSVAKNKPLTFIVKKRGYFTEQLLKLKVGDTIYSRGLYGKEVMNEQLPKAVLIGGGTGEAVLSLLAEKLQKENTSMQFLVGTTSSKGGILEEDLKKYGPYLAIVDNGKPGRILDSIKIKDFENTAVYIVGPEIFMKKAAERVSKQGVKANRIYISMEKNSMCGIGVCGECACGWKLTCQWGTFMTYSYLLKEKVL